MSKLDPLLEKGLRSELQLQERLKALREAVRLQLQETEKRQIEELEKRISQNARLSEDVESKPSDKEEQNHYTLYEGMRGSASGSLLTDKNSKKSQRSDTSSPGCISSTNLMHCSVGTQQCNHLASCKSTQLIKEEEAEAECQKKFCALPVPTHVLQPAYQDMMELREKERKQGHEQRTQFLLSIQKPFSFQEREMKKREKLIAMFSHDQKNSVTQDKDIKHSPQSKPKDQEEVCKVHTETSARPVNSLLSSGPKLRTAERTRKAKLGFLDEKPSFKPKITQQVPDFNRLHKALQSGALRNMQSKDVTQCQPFLLRTSALPPRQRRKSLEDAEIPKTLNRSKSLGALTSLSTDTLPVFITDAARKRCAAIRKSMEMRDCKIQASVEWLMNYQLKSQAMKKTVARHAKFLDPHSSLKEVYHEKLQHHREADQQRMREYMRELRDMKSRVSERPFLFEQVKQRNAKIHAEQIYRSKLKKAGLKVQFVEENGEAIRSEDDEDHSSENDIHGREENEDDGEKIEDVEEKSVKSKREEMP
ncbi:protein FAM161B [Parambassis ranga]|uniref:Protein FAM161B n=1 Tax=Parambassis ranga TaxID=210632 RepID=A0A6P7HTD0_9TELE|nr:protein FAM161B [Parambassis ranga]